MHIQKIKKIEKIKTFHFEILKNQIQTNQNLPLELSKALFSDRMKSKCLRSRSQAAPWSRYSWKSAIHHSIRCSTGEIPITIVVVLQLQKPSCLPTPVNIRRKANEVRRRNEKARRLEHDLLIFADMMFVLSSRNRQDWRGHDDAMRPTDDFSEIWKNSKNELTKQNLSKKYHILNSKFKNLQKTLK